jgi:hypothetical protein
MDDRRRAMSWDQPVWLLKIGRTLREQGERTAVAPRLPRAVLAALDRLAASERERQQAQHEQDERRRRSG